MFFVEFFEREIVGDIELFGGRGGVAWGRWVSPIGPLQDYPPTPPTHCQEISSEGNDFHFLMDQHHLVLEFLGIKSLNDNDVFDDENDKVLPL